MTEDFLTRGWAQFAVDPSVLAWARQAAPEADVAVRAPENAQMHQCDGTWFVGLDALANDATGRVADGPALAGEAVDFARAQCGGWPDLYPAQISVVYPGYPRARAGENEAALRYRQNRDAAHVDGIMGLGTPKRRFVREPHAFILGIPLSEASEDASPLVVWEGSHNIMRAALMPAFQKVLPDAMADLDITDIYQAARREVFETCPRVTVHGPVGSAVLVHRLTLHGVAPWAATATAAPEGRVIAYFRPEMAGGIVPWLAAP